MSSRLDSNTAASTSQAALAKLAARLQAHPFLNGLPKKHLFTLAEYANVTEFAAGEKIFRQGDLANRFYLILDGAIALEAASLTGGSQVIDRIGAGEVLGWSWMFPPFRWHFTARALVATQAIFVYGTWLLECCDTDPALGYELTKRMAGVAIGRLQSARSQLAGDANVALRTRAAASPDSPVEATPPSGSTPSPD